MVAIKGHRGVIFGVNEKREYRGRRLKYTSKGVR